MWSSCAKSLSCKAAPEMGFFVPNTKVRDIYIADLTILQRSGGSSWSQVQTFQDVRKVKYVSINTHCSEDSDGAAKY